MNDINNHQSRLKNATPMMVQYLQVKAEHPDALLFYRMGDFYELFFEDAIKAAEILDIALTKRGKSGDEDIAMCGVPHHSHEPYLQKLIASGSKVVVCEQMETPEQAKKRGHKTVVRREVVRIVTPGTIFEENLLSAKESNYLACLVEVGKQLALSWVDISTGMFSVSETNIQSLATDLSRLNIKELLLSDKLFIHEDVGKVVRQYRGSVTPQAASQFDSERAKRAACKYYHVESLDAYGDFSRAQQTACGALVEYIATTQKGIMPHLNPPKLLTRSHFMAIDAATMRNLELFTTIAGEKKGSLIKVLDNTQTGCGARLLRDYLSAPLTDADAINERLTRVSFFIENTQLCDDIRTQLRALSDIERAMCRISIGRGLPRDVVAIREGVRGAVAIRELLEFGAATELPAGVRRFQQQLGSYDALQQLLDEAVIAEVGGGLARDGGYIRGGYHTRLDELRDLHTNGKQHVEDLQKDYRQRTGVSTLRIKRNNVLGYFVEVSPNHAAQLEEDTLFNHRQSLAGAIRFTTENLRKLESDINNAREEALAIEQTLFDALIERINEQAQNLAATSYAVAVLDVASSFAMLANLRGYSKPVVDHSTAFVIEGGRHPVVECGEAQFVSNGCDLSSNQHLWLITGPNMSGKSTFLRQNALITIMAHMGSYVPANHAHIGVVDKVFSRVGASDDLASGRSTFMVEMVETATILHQATKQSLVILDEIGRGTATFDGLSIAWSVVEFLHNHTRCRGLFATHYHELTLLTQMLPSLLCATIKVREWQGDVIFMHEVIPGKADRSYGIHVAKLAGLPKSVTKRAEDILHKLESSEVGKAQLSMAGDMPLFAFDNNVQAVTPPKQVDSVVEKHLAEVNPDEMSPKEAWECLYRLKEMTTNA